MSWKVKRTFADGTEPENYLPSPADVAFDSNDAAIGECIAYIAEDLGVENGDYIPGMFANRTWEELRHDIYDILKSGNAFAYEDLKWEVVNA